MRLLAAMTKGDFQKSASVRSDFIVEPRMDEAVRGLERLKKVPGVAEGIYRATVTTLEHTRAQVNLRFLADMEQAEKRDAARYEQRENN